MRVIRWFHVIGAFSAIFSFAIAAPTQAALTVFEAAGADAVAIQAKVDAFRLALGALNPPGTPKPDGRREINWDAVPAAALDPLPPDFFNTTSPRGLEMATNGSRLKVSGDDGTPSFLMRDITAQEWGVAYFSFFSPQRIFSPIGSTTTDIVFFVPGTQTRASVTGFGAVYVDVGEATSSKLEAWDAKGRLLAVRYVLPSGAPVKGLSFLGFLFDGGARIARVRVTSGNAPIDSPFMDPHPDGVALDDLIYGEPQAIAAPMDISTWLAVAVRTPGASDSHWRTDVGILNASGFKASYEVRLYVGSGVQRRTGTLAAGVSLTLSDIVGQLTGNDGVGSVEVVSDEPLKVTSRVYNAIAQTAGCYPGASFGASTEAVSLEEALGPGQTGFLAQLSEDASSRTNIAMTNAGPTAATATVALLDAAGSTVGSFDVSLAPGEWKQENRPFSTRAGQNNIHGGAAKVTVKTGSGVLAYATVIDSVTNDPSYVAASR